MTADHGSLRELAGQQAALRRIATLVADGTGPEQLFDAIAAEASRVLGVGAISLVSYDQDSRACTLISATHAERTAVPAGGQWPLDSSALASQIVRTARPVRVDDWPVLPGSAPARPRDEGSGQAVAAPIMVNGSVWGYLAAFSEAGELLPGGCEVRLADYTHLMASSISNAEARDELRSLAESQGALRRVATLVAQGAEPQTVFTTIATEASRLLGVGAVSVISYDADAQTFTKYFGTHGTRSAVPDGTTWPVRDCPEGALVVATGRPARGDDWSTLPGPTAAAHRAGGFGQAVAAPIIVGGEIWGHMAAYGEADEILPPGCELRLADYTNLMATAIANVQIRDELRSLAEQQGAALRRVATLVAQQAPASTIFAAVAGEAGRALRVARAVVARTNGDQVTLLGSSGAPPISVSQLHRAGEPGVIAEVLATRRPARIDDWASRSGLIAQVARRERFGSVVGAPIMVDGSLWGVIVVVADEILPGNAETRLTDFSYLVGGSISNVHAREDLRRLADEQGALRRVATLVAHGAEPRTVFIAVTEEAARVLGVGSVSLASYDAENELFTELYGTHRDRPVVPDGGQFALADCPEGALVVRTGRPGRGDDWTELPGPVAARHRALGFGQAVAAPIIVDGNIWGHIAAFAEAGEVLPAGWETRLADFTQLVA